MSSSEARYLELISGRSTGLMANGLRAGLQCCTPIYAAVTALRNRAFQAGWKQVHRVSVPVISVGNLTTGGTGKTPVVAELVQALNARGAQPGIASRGFRSLDAQGNDEKRVLELLCPGVLHEQDRDRVMASQRLVEAGCRSIVLDDGFQHRRLGRDLDVVLIDATCPWGYGHQLPRGLLRESPRGLNRASLVVITRADLVSASACQQLKQQIRRWTSAPIVVSGFAVSGVVDQRGERTAGEALAGRKVLAFCGIGNPSAFQATVQQLDVQLSDGSVRAFPDHHHYTQADVDELQRQAEGEQATALLCTLKDLVKLPESAGGLPVLAVEIGFEILDGIAEWNRCLDELVQRFPVN